MTEQTDQNHGQAKRTRRRGAALEADILASTLTLLETTRYEDLTMELIARHAHTNKSVLYRRWPSKTDVVLAAIRSRIPVQQFKEPDTGTVHSDLLAMYDEIFTVMEQMHYGNIMGLLRERLHGISIGDFFDRFAGRNYLTQIVRRIFGRAAERGHVNLDDVDDLMYELPVLTAGSIFYGHRDAPNRAQLYGLVERILMPVYARILDTQEL
ncbi:TetR/AcrR family transcriptional regulator [Lacticaseibacillus pantheris]